MDEKSEFRADCVLVYRFQGGPDHGRMLRFDPAADPHGSGRALWGITAGGAPGQQFQWFACDGRRHCYEVISCEEAERTIIVTCDYVGRSTAR